MSIDMAAAVRQLLKELEDERWKFAIERDRRNTQFGQKLHFYVVSRNGKKIILAKQPETDVALEDADISVSLQTLGCADPLTSTNIIYDELDKHGRYVKVAPIWTESKLIRYMSRQLVDQRKRLETIILPIQVEEGDFFCETGDGRELGEDEENVDSYTLQELLGEFALNRIRQAGNIPAEGTKASA